MRIKDNSVEFQNLSPQLLLGLIIVDQVMQKHGQEAVITSLNDAYHGKTSLHYNGDGVDLRSKSFSHPDIILSECKNALGFNQDYDIILEHNHFHLEYQPKRRD